MPAPPVDAIASIVDSSQAILNPDIFDIFQSLLKSDPSRPAYLSYTRGLQISHCPSMQIPILSLRQDPVQAARHPSLRASSRNRFFDAFPRFWRSLCSPRTQDTSRDVCLPTPVVHLWRGEGSCRLGWSRRGIRRSEEGTPSRDSFRPCGADDDMFFPLLVE
jgi:hypothetical protein